MSYPRLRLEGDPSSPNRTITAINVFYENDTSTMKPASLTRLKYDVKRVTQIDNVSGATQKRYPDLAYNSVRLMHTWVGYIDVITESVAITEFSSTEDALSVALIKTAVLLKITSGVPHTIAEVSPNVGPNRASLGGTYESAFEQGEEWVSEIIKAEGETPPYAPVTTSYWLIRDINILDNGNNTSRVTFTFEILEAWQDLSLIVQTAEGV